MPKTSSLILLLAIIFLIPCEALADGIGSLISPGPLSKPHAKYEGITNCVKCHRLGGGIPDALCLDCHDRLAERIRLKQGIHARFTDPCIKCHTDHRGFDHKMIVVDEAAFEHDRTDYRLEGAHARVACGKCHTEKGVYTGLRSACASCHQDRHKKQLPQDCSKCHSFASWKDIKRFDHDRDAAYPLKGRHSAVQCAKCHAGGKYRPISFKSCSDCHTDVHKGQFAGRTCDGCHTVDAWERVTFDHNSPQFKYRLSGAHLKVACEKCHPNGRFKPVEHSACSSCHTDAHKGQFAEKGCEACHTVETWKKTTFDHASPSYKGYRLAGSHQKVSCVRCHEGGKFKPIASATCADCHKDAHKGQFTGRTCDACHAIDKWKKTTFDHASPSYKGYRLSGSHQKVSCVKCHEGGRFKPVASATCADCHKDTHKGQFKGRTCDECHTVETWKKTTFNHASPSYKGYKLAGSHQKVSCVKCHEGGRFKPVASATCTDCHRDTHKGQFTGRKCEECHSTQGWTPVAFNHASSGYKLSGKHRDVVCAKCHVEGVYKGLPREECTDCHEDQHQKQFKGRECQSCHAMDGWKRTIFQFHNDPLFKNYELNPKHAREPCARCHEGGWFKPAPYFCSSCHARDDVHKGALGDNCGRCHLEANWKKTSFDHSFGSFPLTGAHKKVSCDSCHKGSAYRTGKTSCADCHGDAHKGKHKEGCGACHTQSDWKPKGFDHGVKTVFNLYGAHGDTACTSCHIPGPTFSVPNKGCELCHTSTHKKKEMKEGCERCHTQANWKVDGFDHSLTSYELGSSHLKAGCRDCHRSRLYSQTFAECSACHIKSYSKAPRHLSGAYGTECSACHDDDSRGWKFLHPSERPCQECHTKNRPLSHVKSPAKYPRKCEACHAETWEMNHSLITAPCASCHAGEAPATHRQEPGKFSQPCEKCHVHTFWSVAVIPP